MLIVVGWTFIVWGVLNGMTTVMMVVTNIIQVTTLGIIIM